MTAALVPLRGPAPSLLPRIAKVRADGDIPLVTDERWSDEQWLTVCAKVRGAEQNPGTAWATLTSGSGGAARIVLRTSESWASSFPIVAELLDADANDAVALPAPPSSSLTLFSIAHARHGGPRPLLSRGHALNPADFGAATCFHGTPHAFRALLDAGAPPRLRAALVGGSHLDPVLRARAEALGIRVSAYYGAAELSFVALDRGDGLRAFPGAQLRVDGTELWVRSPYIAQGYLTGAGPLRLDDGWATVGDRAELVPDPLGPAVRLLGRADDAILSASATIVPEEVEAALRSLSGVRDAVVFGIPQHRLGALIATQVEPEPGIELTLAGLRAGSARLLGPAHRPRRWFTGDLPRTASGKPARAEALRRVLAGEVASLER